MEINPLAVTCALSVCFTDPDPRPYLWPQSVWVVLIVTPPLLAGLDSVESAGLKYWK
jgi:hypothetical protein